MHGILAARVRPGHIVSVIDASAGGASFEISRRLPPNSSIDLLLETARGPLHLRGIVIRCVVSRLHANSVSYRAAVAFDRDCSAFADDEWTVYSLPATETLEPGPGGVETTRETA
jgi:hypothetical protein